MLMGPIRHSLLKIAWCFLEPTPKSTAMQRIQKARGQMVGNRVVEKDTVPTLPDIAELLTRDTFARRTGRST